MISTDALGRRVQQHRNAIAAASSAGIRHVVYTSLPNLSPSNPAQVAAEHQATEELLTASGLPSTVLRTALYAEHRIAEGQAALKSGRFRHNQGHGRTAYVSRRDCAAAAAAVLASSAEHAGRVYDITGPDLLSAADLAVLYGTAGATQMPAIDVGDAQLVADLIAGGLPFGVAQLLASFGTAIRRGQLDQLSTAVKDLTGHPPQPVSAILGPALAPAASRLVPARLS